MQTSRNTEITSREIAHVGIALKDNSARDSCRGAAVNVAIPRMSGESAMIFRRTPPSYALRLVSGPRANC
jgi:hypothetical protein